MEFTPEQQAFIDASFNKRFAEVNAKAEKALQEAVASAETKYKEQSAAVEKELAEMKKKAASGDKGNDDLTALKARLATLEADKIKSLEMAQKAQLLTVASELNAVSGDQVAMLVSPYIKSEEGQLSVINAEGQARLNGEGKPMAIKEFVTEFLAGNPHLVKVSGTPGAGSQGNRGEANPAKQEALLKLPPAERITAARAAGIKKK